MWPASTETRPKQFLALCGPNTLFENTLARVRGHVGACVFAAPLILGAAKDVELIEASLAASGVNPGAIVLEPMPRNTAAAAAVAAALAEELEPDALVLLLPADHLISDVPAFHRAIETAAPFARHRIVTFGVAPHRPAVEYGYIRAGDALGAGVHAIASFHEKPSAEKAAEYLEGGEYSWNAGIFLFSPQVMLDEFRNSRDIGDGALAALRHAKRDNARFELSALHFAPLPSKPLDTAVMESTARGAVLRCDMGWADVGSLDEVWRLSPQDDLGNVCTGSVVLNETRRTLVLADGVTACVSGVEDLIVIATRDAVLVLPRERAQDVKALRERALKAKA
ncbi:MAG: hypothetical protein K2X34_01875 [Hyphomonadaceae bacterium]|nr:hypothetical protein [Hyphomonadaceae bacterium]